MKKTLLFILFAFIMLFSCSCVSTTKANSFNDVYEKESAIEVTALSSDKNLVEPSPKDSAIIILLYPNITEAINNYFGEPTQVALYDATVNSVIKENTFFRYRVSVTVPTFHGPHNPPYGLETMTFQIKPGSVILEEYVHKDV